MSAKTPARRKKRRGIQFYLRQLFTKGNYFDFPMLFIVIFLVCFGLIMIYSSSSYVANLNMGDPAFFLKRQAAWAVIGMAGLFVISYINYHFYMKFTKVFYLVSFLLQAIVLLLPNSSHGSKRWIQIGPMQFQPSEISKLFLILFLAYMITKHVKAVRSLRGIIVIWIYTLPIFALIAVANMSTSIIIMGITFLMLFVASPKYKPFIILGIAGVALGVIVLLGASYRGARITAWLDPENSENGWQIMQSLYAVGSGGFFGKGLGQSMQKMGFIPESHNDMIFSIICEELGLFGAICIIAMFIMLLWRIMIIANNAPDLYGALICVGVMAQVGIQILINIAVVTNTIPNTGIPLPFISYGGTSLTFLLAEMGIVLSVSRRIKMSRR